jgi:hypothetical protein
MTGPGPVFQPLGDSHRRAQAERDLGFRRQRDRLVAGGHHPAAAGRAARSRSDGRALAASGQRSDDGADARRGSHHSHLVAGRHGLALLAERLGLDVHVLSIGSIQLGQFQRQRGLLPVAGFLRFHDAAFHARALFRDHESARGERGIQRGGECVASLIVFARRLSPRRTGNVMPACKVTEGAGCRGWRLHRFRSRRRRGRPERLRPKSGARLAAGLGSPRGPGSELVAPAARAAYSVRPGLAGGRPQHRLCVVPHRHDRGRRRGRGAWRFRSGRRCERAAGIAGYRR